MKLPTAPLQRIAFGVAFCSLAAMGAGAIALVTQPAASSGGSTTQQVEYLDPVADEQPTTTTTGPVAAPVSDDGSDRAEKAAERAEVAAQRSEVAAVKAETIITSTTTTTQGPVITADKPTLVGTILPMEETTTTTTTVAKRWVEIFRLSPQQYEHPESADDIPPFIDIPVNLATGELRIGNTKLAYWSGLGSRTGAAALWLGDATTPPDGACYISTAHDTPPDLCAVPAGEQTIRLGRQMEDRYGSRWQGFYGNQVDLVIEEYR